MLGCNHLTFWIFAYNSLRFKGPEADLGLYSCQLSAGLVCVGPGPPSNHTPFPFPPCSLGLHYCKHECADSRIVSVCLYPCCFFFTAAFQATTLVLPLLFMKPELSAYFSRTSSFAPHRH